MLCFFLVFVICYHLLCSAFLPFLYSAAMTAEYTLRALLRPRFLGLASSPVTVIATSPASAFSALTSPASAFSGLTQLIFSAIISESAQSASGFLCLRYEANCMFSLPFPAMLFSFSTRLTRLMKRPHSLASRLGFLASASSLSEDAGDAGSIGTSPLFLAALAATFATSFARLVSSAAIALRSASIWVFRAVSFILCGSMCFSACWDTISLQNGKFNFFSRLKKGSKLTPFQAFLGLCF